MLNKIYFLIIMTLCLYCSKAKISSLIANESSKHIITQEWLLKNNKALVWIGCAGKMKWKNIETNNKNDDIYMEKQGGEFFIVTPGIYSATYLEKYNRRHKWFVSSEAALKEKIPFFSFEIKKGEVLYVGYIRKDLDKKIFQVSYHDEDNEFLQIEEPKKFSSSILKELPLGLRQNLTFKKLTEGFLLNDPSVYHFE